MKIVALHAFSRNHHSSTVNQVSRLYSEVDVLSCLKRTSISVNGIFVVLRSFVQDIRKKEAFERGWSTTRTSFSTIFWKIFVRANVKFFPSFLIDDFHKFSTRHNFDIIFIHLFFFFFSRERRTVSQQIGQKRSNIQSTFTLLF